MVHRASVVVTGGLLVVLGLGGCVASGTPAGPGDVPAREWAACGEAGMALDSAALMGGPVPERENRAPLYEAAHKPFVDKTLWPTEVKEAWDEAGRAEWDEVWSEEALAAAALVVKHFGKTLVLVSEARRRPRCSFGGSVEELAGKRHVMGLVELSRLELIAGGWYAQSGGRGAAWDCLLAALALGESLRDEPLLISAVASGVIVSRGCVVASELLAGRAVPEGRLAEVRDALPTRQSIYDHWRRGLNGDMIGFVGPLVRGSAAADDMGPPGEEGVAAAVREYRRLWADAGVPWHALSAASREPVALSDLVPAIGFEQRDVAVAHAELVRLALELERHRLAVGTYPETLEALAEWRGEAGPEDPFSGKAYRYERVGEGCRVWSVGRNGTDDGGAPRDIVVAVGVPRAAPRQGPKVGEPRKPAEGQAAGQPNWREYWSQRMRERRQREQEERERREREQKEREQGRGVEE